MLFRDNFFADSNVPQLQLVLDKEDLSTERLALFLLLFLCNAISFIDLFGLVVLESSSSNVTFYTGELIHK